MIPCIWIEGRYVLRMSGQACELEVADTFFVVASLAEKDGKLFITLNSGRHGGA